jgi:hypothetical protein
MPTKKEIEAELNASDSEKAIKRMRDQMADFEEWESALFKQEQTVWEPHWSRSDPLTGRLSRIGRTPQEIEKVATFADVVSRAARGEPLSPEMQRMADEQAAAENSAMQQLTGIVGRQKKKKHSWRWGPPSGPRF